MDGQSIDEEGVAAFEMFVRESIELDRAWLDGTLDEWIDRKLADERRAAGFSE